MDMKSEEDYDGNHGIIEIGCIRIKIIFSYNNIFYFYKFLILI